MVTLAVSYSDKHLEFTPFGDLIIVICRDSAGEIIWRGKMPNAGFWDGKGWRLDKVLKKLKQWVKEESSHLS